MVLFYVIGPGSSSKAGVVVGIEQASRLNDEAREIPVTEGTVTVNGDSIYWREAKPLDNSWRNKAEVLLLHGGKYTSSTWKGLGTLQILAKNHYRAVAIDLPNYGLSKKAKEPNFINSKNVVAWMEALVTELNLRSVVLLVPSVSGGYGLPLLMNSNKVDLLGMITIAPSRSEAYNTKEYEKVALPVMVMYGELDHSDLAKNAKHFLTRIPDSTEVIILKGEHAAFVGNHLQFHKELLTFLQQKCNLGSNDLDIDHFVEEHAQYDEEFDEGGWIVGRNRDYEFDGDDEMVEELGKDDDAR